MHRDVKPENVLLTDDGRVKVADFGLARAISAATSTAATQGMLIGTVAYLSPEQVERGIADARSDVYGAGILLYEMVTGAVPFAGETPLAVAYQHVNADRARAVVRAPGHLPGGRPDRRPRAPRATPTTATRTRPRSSPTSREVRRALRPARPFGVVDDQTATLVVSFAADTAAQRATPTSPQAPAGPGAARSPTARRRRRRGWIPLRGRAARRRCSSARSRGGSGRRARSRCPPWSGSRPRRRRAS